MYCNKFFETQEEALAFQRSHGGALYKNIKRSRTKESYRVEAMMAIDGGWLRSADIETHPYCVAWSGEPMVAGKEN